MSPQNECEIGKRGKRGKKGETTRFSLVLHPGGEGHDRERRGPRADVRTEVNAKTRAI
jgi:hypothetical protein